MFSHLEADLPAAVTIGLPTEHLRQPIRKCLSRESAVEKMQMPATNRRGRSVRLAVTCAPFALGKHPTWGALITEEEAAAAAAAGAG